MIDRIFLCFFIILIFPVIILPQTFSSQKLITSDLQMAYRCFAADLDTDGDLDVISLSSSKIAWYENTDGQASFGSGQLLSNLIEGGGGLYASKLDSNDYANVLWVSPLHMAVFMLKNPYGNATFSLLDTIAIGPIIPDHPNCIYATDLDSDSDLDVIVGDRDLYWFENQNGSHSFSTFKKISQPGQVQTVFSVLAADIDGDADMDVLSASIDDDKVAWYENTDSAGSFEQHVITTQANGTESVYAFDLDADGDTDVLSASMDDGTIAWYENQDGAGSFSAQKIISDSLPGAGWVFAVDMDNDDDPDIVASSQSAIKIVWYENINGYGTFGRQNVIASPQYGPSCIYPTDLDGDGDTDILATILNNKLVWYENLTNPNSIQKNHSELPKTFQLYQNYPNPFNPSTVISYLLSVNTEVELAVYNMIGQKVATLVNGWQKSGEHKIRWHADGLSSGTYVVRLQTDSQIKTIKLVLQK